MVSNVSSFQFKEILSQAQFYNEEYEGVNDDQKQSKNLLTDSAQTLCFEKAFGRPSDDSKGRAMGVKQIHHY